jgi:hypothetical protein
MTFNADRVSEASTSLGVDPYVLNGAFNANFQSALTAGVVDGDKFDYSAHDPANGGFETGMGTWRTGGVLFRTTIYSSSHQGRAVDWPAGTRQVSLTLTATALTELAIPSISYDARATLRTMTGRNAMIEGLGIFHFVQGGMAGDDDETTFASTDGVWLLAAIAPDYMAAQMMLAI